MQEAVPAIYCDRYIPGPEVPSRLSPTAPSPHAPRGLRYGHAVVLQKLGGILPGDH